MKRKSEGIYYGWYIVAVFAVTETLSYGILYYAFSVFITPMQAQMGWSLAQITGAFSLGLLVSGFVGLPVGVWLDKYGARFLMTTASILATLLLFAWAYVETLPMFYIIWVLLGATMAMLFYDPAFVVVANWFKVRRSAALAVVTFAAGFASTIFLPLSDYLLITVGWRHAIAILAVIYGVLAIPLHGLVLRRRPEDLGLLLDGLNAIEADKPHQAQSGSVTTREAIRSRAFFWLTLAFGLSMLASISIRVHFIPYLINTGFDSSTAAWLAGFIGITQVVGRVIFAPLEMRFSSRTVATVIMVVLTLSFGILLFSQRLFFVWAFVLFFGAAFGAMTLARPMLLADLYGIAEYGRINGIMAFMMTIVLTLAPIGAGLIFEWTGSYQTVLWVLLVFSALSVMTIIRLPNIKRKRASQ